ncbi:MAG TPA: hypothetical protein DCY48_02200 [Candidatus Magasanikbacteria bacterium]|nr:MAG: hypothetical protein A3I74_01105 [Candidatus Magasanikbacteria bacterium RIFCSPLOWO2_02_FULL_47_16]OGH79958.1 MAG: hypothetical protein A3C10_02120 [Candidatus Magasanikbacteria bacterium RIFCSPHIGHO2_02_FULL_48_18]OGH82970.1 MAG: hypothetical protein A3G08_03605 [Candidatus Magasanikbacteria bacterium RIFCSPLOWO2_12_FULL_47_9b]HAZ28567.1 hypothetical protein [Candidatus Magasanikbacteria bacterium]
MYLSWNKKIITDFSADTITTLYNEGYVFTRIDKGVMNQTRSLRIDLEKFNLTSENRRILRKTESLELKTELLPLPNYDWKIGKLAKDFYTEKFGSGTLSANKAKELLTDETKTNFNIFLVYNHFNATEPIGYAICYENNSVLHYCYPFYQLLIVNSKLSNVGIGMMLKAILWAKEQGKKYVYLGSFQRPGDVYKLQFKGLEWFDGEGWQTDIDTLKDTLSNTLNNVAQKLIIDDDR